MTDKAEVEGANQEQGEPSGGAGGFPKGKDKAKRESQTTGEPSGGDSFPKDEIKSDSQKEDKGEPSGGAGLQGRAKAKECPGGRPPWGLWARTRRRTKSASP